MIDNSLLRKFNWDYPDILDGSSHWDVVLHVPHKPTDYNVMFEASSTLEGVSVGVSDIINKTAEQNIPVEINFKMLDDARQLKINSTDRLNLQATFDDDNNWQFDVTSPVITGNGEINADLDVNTTGKFDLEFLNLSAFMRGDGVTARKWKLQAANVPSLRVKAEDFVWKDWRLSNVEFETDHHPRGMVINKININDPHILSSLLRISAIRFSDWVIPAMWIRARQRLHCIGVGPERPIDSTGVR